MNDAARARTMQRWAGRTMIGLGLLHLVLFTAIAAGQGVIPGWLAGELRTPDVWNPEMTQSQAMFWISLGSFAVPLVLLGALVHTLAGAGQRVPTYLGYGLAAWLVVCTVILEPSGFPACLIPVGLLIAADRIQRRPAHAGSASLD